MFLESEHACFEVQQQHLDKNVVLSFYQNIFLSKYLFIKISFYQNIFLSKYR
jgi:hypothetical protein